MTEPTPVRCPAPPEAPDGDDPTLGPLLARLADPAPPTTTETFPRGTLQPDGRLDLCKQSLSPVDARRVITAAVTSGHARHLLLGTNGLGAPGIAALADALTPDHRLQTLYLGCNHVDAGGLAPLADRLAGDRTVRAVWLKRNPIGDEGAAVLAESLRHNASVRTLDLTNTGLTVAGLTGLAAALATRPRPLQRLYLGGNNLGPESVDVLAGLLRSGVDELYLAAGRLGDDGATGLAGALHDVAAAGRRVVLGLGGNGIRVGGVRALSARLGALVALDLARPPSASVLRAEPNEVGDEGAFALADALPGSGLRRLDLRHTGVRGRGARRLVAAAGELEILGLGSGVPRRMKRAAAQVLREPGPPADDVRAIASVYR
ncbi:gala protein [Virgisporangium ochraceum]|uniref:gala protein n=1 Tax=Virgisporangium ochraceum TaxID=65505 RepID=UPI00194086B5|nr:gala protein [Virgisporangium ochraceum]